MLCECKEVVIPSRLPVEIISEGGGKPWKMVAAKTAESQPAGFAEKLSKLFVQEGKSVFKQIYHTHQLEFLALKWTVVDTFHDYLYGLKFIVRTDINPPTCVLTIAKLNATEHHWLAALATYDFSLQYKPGCHNIDVDVFSRYPLDDVSSEEWMEIPQSGVKAICQMVISDKNEESSTRLVG